MWTTRELEDARARVQTLLDDGLSVREIADETGIPKSTVHRIKKAIEAMEAMAMPNDPDLLIFAQAVLQKTGTALGTSADKPRKAAPANPRGELKALQIITITHLSHCPMR